jgi:hypothetical protein
MNLTTFKGVNHDRDSSDDPAALRFAEGVMLSPRGGLSRAPWVSRAWDLFRLTDYASSLGLTAQDRACLLKVECGSDAALVVVDFQHRIGLGFQWIKGGNGSNLGASGATLQVLWRRLQPRMRWFFSVRRNQVLMGNGADPNLLYDIAADSVRMVAGQLRPLTPIGTPAGAIEQEGANATLNAFGLRWEALEPRFDPSVEYPYQRAAGNYVRVSVGIHAETSFRSTLEGKGTAGEPYHYRLAAPAAATNDQAAAFVQRDPNAAGIVRATVLTAGGLVTFSEARLRGGRTQFEARDVFTGPDVEVAATYFRQGAAGAGFETVPSALISVQGVGGQRVAVTVSADAAPGAADYDSIRIYVGENKVTQEPDRYEATPNGTFIIDRGGQTAESAFGGQGYRGLRLALEVPNANGTYIIAPSMLTGRELSIKNRIPPPSRAFTFAYTREWYGGSVAEPRRLAYSQTATDDQRLPEGVGAGDTIDLPTTDPQDALTALTDLGGFVLAYSRRNAYRIGTDFSITSGSLVSGPLNQDCLVNWSDQRQLFLGADFNLYEARLPDSNDAASNAPVSTLMIPGAAEYIARFADRTNPGLYACSVPDYRNQRWFLWVRGLCGKQLGFVVDVAARQLTGPFTSGGYISVSLLPDGRIMGIDLAGNLRHFDPDHPANLNDTFDAGAPVTLLDGTQVPGRLIDGEAVARVLVNGQGRYIRHAALVTARTGWLATQDDRRSSIKEVVFHTVAGSAGLAFVTIENERGAKVTRFYGEVHGKTFHRLPVLVSGTAFQTTLQILCGDQRPCALRSLTLNHSPTGRN